MRPIEMEVDRLYKQLLGNHGDRCEFPVIGGGFIKGVDDTSRERRLACRALAAREWFAQHGPPDAPPLPLSHNDREDLKRGGVGHVVALYARSLWLQEYDVEKHPSFHDYACGVMASGLIPSHDEGLRKRFPPRPLAGLNNGLCWSPPGPISSEQRSEAEAARGLH